MLTIRRIIVCAGLSVVAVGAASGAEDPVSRLRHTRSLRCTYTASAMTSFRPDREITTEHDEIIAVYDNISIERGTARVIYEKGIFGRGSGDLTVRWQANALWFIETAPAGNLILTAVFSRYAQGTTDFIALDSRPAPGPVIVSGVMSSGTCKAIT
jgi:hypothetical protein